VVSGCIDLSPLGDVMSDTLSIDVVGPSYWAYMATVMADCLEEISRSKRIRHNQVPLGVYRDAKKFFQLVMQSVRKDPPDNPPASLNAYVIAAYAVKGSSDEDLTTLKDLGDRLKGYSKLLDRLNQAGSLNQQDAQTAKDLKQFFRELAQVGEAEIYERTVDYLEPALSSYR
jgi:hypothetical protein